MTMTIAIYTVITGNYDTTKQPLVLTKGCRSVEGGAHSVAQYREQIGERK